jgi:hypothetical protein
MALESKALANVPDRFRGMVAVLEDYPGSRYNLLIPSVYQERSALFRPALTTLRLNADPKSGDCYQTPGSSDKVSPSAVALKRLANAQGLSWENTSVEHPNGEKWIAVGQAAATFVSNTGEVLRVTSSYRLDLTDDGVVAQRIVRNAKTADNARRDVDQKRQFIDQLAETGAMSRVVRQACGLRSSFTPEEFSRPFVAVKFVPDDSNPIVQQALVDRMAGRNRDVFGGPPQSPPRELPAGEGRAEDDIHEGEFRDELEPRDVARATEPDAPEPAILAPEPTVDLKQRAGEIAAHIDEIRINLAGPDGTSWSKATREKEPTEKAYGESGGQLLSALTESKQLAPTQQLAIRKAVYTVAFGPYRDWKKLNADQVAAVTVWAKGWAAEVQELVAHLVETDETLADLKASRAR